MTRLPLPHMTQNMSRALGSAGGAEGSTFQSPQSLDWSAVNGTGTDSVFKINNHCLYIAPSIHQLIRQTLQLFCVG